MSDEPSTAKWPPRRVDGQALLAGATEIILLQHGPVDDPRTFFAHHFYRRNSRPRQPASINTRCGQPATGITFATGGLRKR